MDANSSESIALDAGACSHTHKSTREPENGADTTASGHFTVFLVPVAIIALCYGGGFGTMPAFATDVFGAKNAGAIYGAMLRAWSADAIAGPLLIAAVPYRTALPLIAAMLAMAAGLPPIFRALVQSNNPVCTETVQSGMRRRSWPYMR
jgi:MFS family permease